MTETIDIVQLTIYDECKDLFTVYYSSYILNKKEILKFLTSFIEVSSKRKLLKTQVENNYYRQETFSSVTPYIEDAIF